MSKSSVRCVHQTAIQIIWKYINFFFITAQRNLLFGYNSVIVVLFIVY